MLLRRLHPSWGAPGMKEETLSLKHINAWAGRTDPAVRRKHFREWALSRRQALRAVGGMASLAVGSSVLMPSLVQAAGGDDPRPLAGGIQPLGPGTETFHLFLPGAGAEPSLISDFNGFVARANIGGTGTGTDASGKMPLLFDVDAGFMQGDYVGMDRQVHTGTFGFI